MKMDTESLRTSVSSPHLSSMAGQASPQEDLTDGVRGGGGGGGGGEGVTPLYAVVKKKVCLEFKSQQVIEHQSYWLGG